MLSALKSFFSPSPLLEEAHALYVQIVARARDPKFYTDFGVPDTLDGRFDLIALHLSFELYRLRAQPQTGELMRALQEVFFADMDRSLREMGVSDTGVGKRIKKMTQAFYGRLQVYEIALQNSDSLREALLRNLYRGGDVNPARVDGLISYLSRMEKSG